MDATSRYLSLADAATFCGYRPGYFSKLLRRYALPRKGPGGNRFDVLDLEHFMSDPDAFKPGSMPKRQHRAGGFTPVTI